MPSTMHPRPRRRALLAAIGLAVAGAISAPAGEVARADDPTGWITVGLPGGFGAPFVSGQEFTASTGTFIVTVDDPGTPEVPDHTWTVPDDFPDGGASAGPDSFHLDGPFNDGTAMIEPGFVVEVTDGVVVRTTTVRAMEWTAVDMAADTVSGFADPLAGPVEVSVGNPEQWRSTQVHVSATPDPADGSWTADFAATRDLLPTDSGFISISDDDGDQTGILWGAPFVAAGIDLDGPDGSADPIWGGFWFFDDEVEVWVTDPGGAISFGPVTRPVENWHWHGWGLDGENPTGLAVGDIVHVRGLQTGTEVAHAVMFLTVDGLELAGPDGSGGNVLYGSAQTTGHYGFARIELDQAMRFVDVDPGGSWFVDFYAPPDEDGEWGDEVRLAPGVTGRVELRGPDGNLTYAWFGEGGGGEPPYDPVVQAHVTEEFFRGENWHPGSMVSVTLYEHEGGPVVQPFDAMVIDVGGDGTFHMDAHEPESGLQPGMLLVVTDGETTKSLHLVEVRFDSFDPDTDVLTGFAPERPNAGEIRLHLFDELGQPMHGEGERPISVHPGGDAWAFDLTTLGYDPSGVTEARVEVPDVGDLADPTEFDGDGTMGQLPFFRASPQYDFVFSNLFDDDPTVVVDLYRDGDLAWTSGPLATSPQGEFFTDPASGIEVGDLVVVTGQTTGVVKTLTVGSVSIDSIDVEGDAVSGTAPAGALVRVNVGNEWCGSEARIFAGGDGTWTADFSGQPGCEEGVDFDLTFDMNTEASVLDPDMDENVAMADLGPHILSLDGGFEPVEVGTTSSLAATFFDLEFPDAHTATIDWGDGTTTLNPVAPPEFHITHAYAAAGIYTAIVTVTDQHGLSDTAMRDFVVYDPNGGFVTGGGWFDSPAGALVARPEATGQFNFGFVAKYDKNASAPTGNANFQLQVADLHFRSTGLSWLVVGGDDAIFSGVGTINGSGQFGFVVLAVDDPGGGDAFRTVIWNEDDGELVYDNMLGGDGPMSVDHGSIVIHTKKK